VTPPETPGVDGCTEPSCACCDVLRVYAAAAHVPNNGCGASSQGDHLAGLWAVAEAVATAARVPT
jgi:hypothetical protein